VIALAAVIWTAVHLGASIDHLAAPANNPVVLVLDLLRNKTLWPPVATIVVAAEVVIRNRLGSRRRWVIAHHRGRREVVDVLARRLPRNAKALRRYSNPEHAPVAWGVGPGWLGRDVVSGAVIRQSWEDVAAIIAGARQERPRPRSLRPSWLPPAPCTHLEQARCGGPDGGSSSKNGAAVWIFDPQGIAEGQPTWWWNPLDMATNLATPVISPGSSRRQPASGRPARCLLRSGGRRVAGHLVLAAR